MQKNNAIYQLDNNEIGKVICLYIVSGGILAFHNKFDLQQRWTETLTYLIMFSFTVRKHTNIIYMCTKKNLILISTFNTQIKFLSVTLILFISLPTEAYHSAPPYGYSYVDSGGHYINVKFGFNPSSSSSLNGHYYELPSHRPTLGLSLNPNAIQSTDKKLFTPALRELRPESDGQVEEYIKFLKEAAEEDAKEAGKVSENTSKAYVSVKLGNDKGYNYQY